MQAAIGPADVPSAAFDRVIQELRPVPRWLDVMWWIGLAMASAGFVYTVVASWSALDLMLASGLLATALGLVVLRWLLSQVKPTLRSFWEQGVVSHAEQFIDKRIANAPAWRRITGGVPRPSDEDLYSRDTQTETYYLAFIRSVYSGMNHWLGLSTGLLFLVAIWLAYGSGFFNTLNTLEIWARLWTRRSPFYVILFFGSMFVAFILG